MKDKLRTEIRKDSNGQIDEVLIYLDGECIYHLETMSDQSIWFAIYTEDDDEHFWISSKNGKSHISIQEHG